MKLIYRIALRLSAVLIPLMALWATLFYFMTVDEINDEADDALADYSELIIIRMLAGRELPPLNSGSNNSYSITPIDREYAESKSHIIYYDAEVYIPEKEETEPARILSTIFRDNDDNYYELKVAMPTFEKNDLVFATGPAGSGKTFIAIALAVKALKNKQVRKIILSRPAVEAGEKLGFLPGEMKDKLDPYLQPLYDALQDMIPALKLKEYMENNVIQIAPLAFMRGRTLNDAVIILDEAQNTTTHQIKMFLTRLGLNAKMIVTGDMTQIDLPASVTSGLKEAMNILKGVEGIGWVEFNKKDIVRHKLVQRIVEAYDRFDKTKPKKNG